MRLYSWLDLFSARLRSLYRRRPRRPRPASPAGRARGLTFERLEDRLLLAAPNPVNLTGFTGATGFQVLGGAAGENLGTDVTNLGDINGDGYEDFAIGTDQRGVHVIFGRPDFTPTAGTIDLTTPLVGTQGFTLSAVGMTRRDGGALAPPTGMGLTVAGGGDFNADGLHDILVGMPNWNDSAGTAVNNRGGAFVIFGATDIGQLGGPGGGVAGVFNLAPFGQTAGQAGQTTNGWGNEVVGIAGFQDGERAGPSVAIIGEVNGHGFDDVTDNPNVLNNHGQAYVVFGKFIGPNNGSGWRGNSVVDLNNEMKLTGAGSGDQAGWAVGGVGDVNGDGIHDFAVTARYDDDSEANSGTTYLIFGSTSLGANLSLTPGTFNGSNGVALIGIGNGDRSGTSVSGGGDINGDGFDDQIGRASCRERV